MNRNPRPEAGISFVEILVSSLILSFALASFFNLFSLSSRQIVHTREHIIAQQLSAELLDQVCAMPFSSLPQLSERPLASTDSGSLLLQNAPATMLILSDMPPGFERNLSIISHSEVLKEIVATIRWGSGEASLFTSRSYMEFAR